VSGAAGARSEIDALARRGRLSEALRLLRAHHEISPAERRRRLALIRALAPAARRRSARARPAPQKLLILDATTRCNQECVYCFERSAHFTKPDLGFSEIESILESARRDGFTHVNFIGGEITLVPWLPRAARLIRRLGMGAGIVTNGLALSSSRAAEALADSGVQWIELSFLSNDPATDFLTGGRKTGFALRRRALENLRALKRRGDFAFGVNVVLTAYNVGALPAMLDFVLDFAPDQVMLKGVHITDNIEDPGVVPRFSVLRGPLDAAMSLLDARRVPFLFEDIPLCFVRPEYWLDRPEREGTGGVGFAYGSADGAPDFRIFTGRDGAGLEKCRTCLLSESCCLPSKRYVALFGEGEFPPP
jgi:hypothetical protein